MKRLFIFLLCLLPLIICSCGADTPSYFWQISLIDISEAEKEYPAVDFSQNSYREALNDENSLVLYTTIDNTADGQNGDASSCFIVCDINTGGFELVRPAEINAETGEVEYNSYDIAGFFRLSDGSFVAERYIVPPMYSDGVYENNGSWLAYFDRDGILQACKSYKEIDERIGADGVETELLVSSQGTAYIMSEEIIAAVASDFELMYTIDLYEQGLTDSSVSELELISDSAGNVFLTYKESTGISLNRYVRRLDDQSMKLGEAAALPYTGNYRFYLAPGYDVYYRDMYGLYGINADDGEPVQLLYWLDIDLSGSEVRNIYIISEDKLLLTFSDPLTGEPMTGIVTRSEGAARDTRKVISVAYEKNSKYAVNLSMQNYVRSFNLNSGEYRVQLNAYETDDVSTAGEKLTRDIISGSVPDIVLFGYTITPEPFIKSDTFVDLYDFIDRDKSLNCPRKQGNKKEHDKKTVERQPKKIVQKSYETVKGTSSLIM